VRLERIDVHLTGAECAALLKALDGQRFESTRLQNLTNELRARLQRRDTDPQTTTDEDWLA
jgi:hypothetical protein